MAMHLSVYLVANSIIMRIERKLRIYYWENRERLINKKIYENKIVIKLTPD